MPDLEVRLRPLVAGDAHTFASWADDATFRLHAGWRQSESRSAAITWWLNQIEDPDPRLIRLLALREHEAVGYIDLYGGDGTRELGYLIAPSQRWGQGLGTAAARAALVHGFDTLGLDCIWAEAVEANVASVRILRRLGLRQTGVGDAEQFLGQPSRFLRFEVFRSDWR